MGWGMKQLKLATTGFERYGKTTRRARFLAEIERVVPWSALCELIEPVYPKPGNGRPPVGVERMLRIYLNPAVEEALYDSRAMRRFVGIDLGCEPVPDETTVCRLRHLLETHELGHQLFAEVQRHLAANGRRIATGTIVDAVLAKAGISMRPLRPRMPTRPVIPRCIRRRKEPVVLRDEGAFRVGSRTKLIHAVVATPANVADSAVLPNLLHGKSTRVWGDPAYRGQRAVIRTHAPKAQDFINRQYRQRGVANESERAKNRNKSKVEPRSNIRSGSSSQWRHRAASSLFRPSLGCGR